jgi:hypothetical protein
VPRRDLQAVPCRDAGADLDEAGTPGPLRLRVRAQRHRQGWRHVKATDRHTAVDHAHVLKELADRYFANAKTIVLVQDNLNIHSKGSLYEAFPAAEARRLVERFEWHYPPKHGSWLVATKAQVRLGSKPEVSTRQIICFVSNCVEKLENLVASKISQMMRVGDFSRCKALQN